MSRKIFKRILISFVILLAAFTSCSVKYDEGVDAEDVIPEFTFTNAAMIRYENKIPQTELNAEVIEQYADNDETYAKNVHFKYYNNKGELETEGQCGYLYTNTKTELYELYDDIKLFNRSRNTNFYANVLRWNAKNEQLTGSRTDTVKIEKDNTVLYGSGFSASGVSNSYSFSGSVSGDIDTKDAAEASALQSEEETDVE